MDLGGGHHRCHERPIGVAIGGHDCVKRLAVYFGSDGEILQTIELLVGNVLRVDGNERLAAPRCDYLGAKLAQDALQDVAADRRMLIHKHAQARETPTGEAGQVTTNVRFFGDAIEGR